MKWKCVDIVVTCSEQTLEQSKAITECLLITYRITSNILRNKAIISRHKLDHKKSFTVTM